MTTFSPPAMRVGCTERESLRDLDHNQSGRVNQPGHLIIDPAAAGDNQRFHERRR